FADSEIEQKKTWAWYSEVARTRLMPDGRELLVQTRWNQNDLAGKILNSPAASEWTVLTLPAIAEEQDQLNREHGEALWPERYPVEQLPSVARGEISERGWCALYQQRPSSDTGGMFRRDWMARRYG